MSGPVDRRLELPRWSAVSSPETPPADAAVVAAFDVDGTVTTHDCVVPFLRRVTGTVGLVAGMLRQLRRAAPAAIRGDRDTLKLLSARTTFRGRTVAEIATIAEVFASTVAAEGLRPDAVARIRWHQCEGHRVVFVSASFGVYLRPLAESLRVDDVIGTELAVDGAGRYTGELDGQNCRGAEKQRRLTAWLGTHAGGRAGVHVWAYGDSAGDAEMLAAADTAVWATAPIPELGP